MYNGQTFESHYDKKWKLNRTENWNWYSGWTKFANFWNFNSFPNRKNSENLIIFQVVKF